MESGIWLVEQRKQYAPMMLYHNVRNSDEERKIKKMIEEQEKKELQKHFLQKSTVDVRNLGDWYIQINRQKNQHGKKKWRRKWYQG